MDLVLYVVVFLLILGVGFTFRTVYLTRKRRNQVFKHLKEQDAMIDRLLKENAAMQSVILKKILEKPKS